MSPDSFVRAETIIKKDIHMRKRIVVTNSDIERLNQLLEATSPQSDHAGRYALEQELDRAEIVTADEIAGNVVTMNSRVRLHDLDRDVEFVCSIVFPAEANSDQNRISILAPLGTALLGYRAGQTVRFPAPGGLRTVRITAIEYQPEASARKRVAA
jgi:regulator of nucleoside diphosphate kinase